LISVVQEAVTAEKLVKAKEKQRVASMNEYLAEYEDRAKLHAAATKIRNLIYMPIKKRKQARLLRQKLKTLPYVCRTGYVKMEYLKQDTA